MQSKVHELSHISSCFIYPPASLLLVFFLFLCIDVRYSALCKLEALGCLWSCEKKLLSSCFGSCA